MGKRRKWTEADKRAAARSVVVDGRTRNSIATEKGVSFGLVDAWVQQFGASERGRASHERRVAPESQTLISRPEPVAPASSNGAPPSAALGPASSNGGVSAEHVRLGVELLDALDQYIDRRVALGVRAELRRRLDGE